MSKCCHCEHCYPLTITDLQEGKEYMSNNTYKFTVINGVLNIWCREYWSDTEYSYYKDNRFYEII